MLLPGVLDPLVSQFYSTALRLVSGDGGMFLRAAGSQGRELVLSV
jgi:hypothetical protein